MDREYRTQILTVPYDCYQTVPLSASVIDQNLWWITGCLYQAMSVDGQWEGVRDMRSSILLVSHRIQPVRRSLLVGPLLASSAVVRVGYSQKRNAMAVMQCSCVLL